MSDLLHDLNSRMRKMPAVTFACGIFLCLAVGHLQAGHCPGFYISLLCLIPVFWIAFVLGPVPGTCLAAVSVTVSLLAWRNLACVHEHVFLWTFNAFLLAVYSLFAVFLAHALAGALKREEGLSRHDPLTKAYNAKAFYQSLEIEARRCRRYNRPLAVAYIDCDDFKVLNERFGRKKGDEVLKLTSDIVRLGLRLTDTFARMPGDEFAVILPETHHRDAKNIFLRIRKSLAEDLVIHETKATFSIGVATFLNPPEALESMVQKAQALMRDAKANGKNMVNAEVFGASNMEKGQP